MCLDVARYPFALATVKMSSLTASVLSFLLHTTQSARRTISKAISFLQIPTRWPRGNSPTPTAKRSSNTAQLELDISEKSAPRTAELERDSLGLAAVQRKSQELLDLLSRLLSRHSRP